MGRAGNLPVRKAVFSLVLSFSAKAKKVDPQNLLDFLGLPATVFFKLKTKKCKMGERASSQPEPA